jgi:tetratricopeptide (TPR) repeat protein
MKAIEKKQLNESLKQCTDDAQRVSVYYEWASRLYDEDRHQAAIPLYQAALDLEKSPNGRGYFLAQIGICYYFLENDREAARFLARAKKSFRPKAVDFNGEICGLTQYYLGAIYSFQGKPRRALAEQLAALPYAPSLHKENLWLLFMALSRSYEQLGKNDEAIQYDQRAIEVVSDQDPNLTYLYESMAHHYFELGRYDDALKAYQKILELDPAFVHREEVYGRIGNCYQNLTNYRSALDAYKTILEVKQLTGSKQGLTRLHIQQANCHFRLGDFNTAIETAKQGLKLRPKDDNEKAQLNSLISVSLYELGSEDAATRVGEKALALSSHFQEADQLLFRLAMAYHKLGNGRKFRQMQTRCKRAFPNHPWNKLLDKLG